MAFVLEDRVRESSVTTGTGAIALGGAPGGYQRFSAVMSVGDTCWYAIAMPGSSWETGIGTYSAANTLTRTTVVSSSNAGSLVTFGVGSKDVMICQPAKKAQAFPAGTLMLFQQSTAPIYWTKQTTHNDKALRVVSGTASSGGANAFSTVMAKTTVGNTTITQSTMASHAHTYVETFSSGTGETAGGGFSLPDSFTTGTTSSIGGNASHTHSILMDIAYVDLIICSKDAN